MAKKIETIFSIQDKYTKTMSKIINSSILAEKKINKVSYATDKFNEKMNKIKAPSSNKITNVFDKIKNKADTTTSSVGGLIKTLLSLATAKIAMDVIDTTTLTNSRLSMINDGKQTDKQLQNKIIESANSSRSSYATTASNVSKLGLLAGDAFNSNNEIIRFSELLNKSFKVGGASTQEQEAGTYQLTQAMAAGKLQGDEFRSVMENAPLVADAIAKYTGKTKGQLKEMSSEGTITADIIKNAMLKAADEIEGRYKKMPKIFGDYWTLIKNKAIQAFNPVIEKVNTMINSPQFEEFFNNLCVGIQLVAEATNWLIDGITWLFQVLEPVKPLLLSVAGAFLILTAATKLASAAKWLFGDALSMLATKSGIAVFALLVLTAVIAYLWFKNDEAAYWILYAWDALIIGAMTLLIGIKTAFYAIIIAGQTLWVGILGVVYGIMAALYGFETGCQTVAVGIALIFQYMYNSVADRINGIITLLNKLPGVKIDAVQAATFGDEMAEQMINDVTQRNKDLEGIMNQIKSTSTSIKTNKSKFVADLENDVLNLQTKVQNNEKTRQDRVDSRNNWLGDIQNKINGALDIGNNAAAKLTNGGKDSIPVKADGGKLDTAGEVNISDEDLKYMKDFAEQEWVNKFTTATLAPNVTVSFGDVHETADAEKLKGRIEEILKEEIAEVAEGVYD